MGQAAIIQAPSPADAPQVPEGTDLIEWYYERGYSDGLPLVAPTPEKIAAVVAALGGDAGRFSAFIPGWGAHVLAGAARCGRRAAVGRAGVRGRHLLRLRSISRR